MNITVNNSQPAFKAIYRAHVNMPKVLENASGQFVNLEQKIQKQLSEGKRFEIGILNIADTLLEFEQRRPDINFVLGVPHLREIIQMHYPSLGIKYIMNKLSICDTDNIGIIALSQKEKEEYTKLPNLLTRIKLTKQVWDNVKSSGDKRLDILNAMAHLAQKQKEKLKTLMQKSIVTENRSDINSFEGLKAYLDKTF